MLQVIDELRHATPRHEPSPARMATGQNPHDDAADRALRAGLMDALEVGLITTQADGRVVDANRTASAWCGCTAPLVIVDGWLRTRQPDDEAKLLHAMVLARQARRSMMTFNSPGGPQSIGVVPLPGHAGQGLSVLFVLGSRGQPSALALQFFCQTHGLTSAEAAVLARLARGLSPGEVASQGSVAVSTVRSQIAAVRAKTGARSVAHLLRMVHTLPPLAQVNGFVN
jgi:DNA-binding CsgD family transcriptional regulator